MLSSGSGSEQKRNGNRGISPPPTTPLGGVGGVGKSNPTAPADADRRAWLKTNLPTVAKVVEAFADAFGRENIRVAFASENGHVIGQPSDGDAVVAPETQRPAKAVR